MTAIGAAATPASALPLHHIGGGNLASGAVTLKPVEVQAGQLPRPQPVPKTRPSYCMLHNCIVPSGKRAGG